MIKQKCESYNMKIHEIEQKTNKFNFPFHRFIQEEVSDYCEFLTGKANKYKEDLNSRLVKVVDIELPSNKRFESIVKRAFEKRPPFEGNDSKSDKGFKDALLWESILEYNTHNQNLNILLYSNDKLFCDELITEFKTECEDWEIKIFNKNQEGELRKELESIALRIDKYSYIEESKEDLDKITLWISSDDFKHQILKLQDHLEEVNKYTIVSDITNEEIYDIEQFDTEDGILKNIRISMRIGFRLLILEKVETSQEYDVHIYSSSVDGTVFEIDDIEIE